jgi:pantoate--beta-alanine ligase
VVLTMTIIHDPAELTRLGGSVFVPTMGALHDGHAALIRCAAAHAARARGASSDSHRPAVVVSVFVNPTQFNDSADYTAYPRTLERDAAIAASAGADVVFAPNAAAVYPPDGSPAAAAAALPGVADLPAVARLPGLEDAHRPGHFAGVYAVVARLFQLTGCRTAVFGEKDWQQLLLIRALIEREKLGIELIAHPTVREADGLALSSRNARLSPEQRSLAVAIPRAIAAAQAEREPGAAERAAHAVLERAGLVVEYAVVRDAATLLGVQQGQPARVLVAARLGATRLIDNAAWPGNAG